VISGAVADVISGAMADGNRMGGDAHTRAADARSSTCRKTRTAGEVASHSPAGADING
jgi:hypothetical protein